MNTHFYEVNLEKIDDNDNRRFGIWTDDTKREQMMELLLMIVHKYKERNKYNL